MDELDKLKAEAYDIRSFLDRIESQKEQGVKAYNKKIEEIMTLTKKIEDEKTAAKKAAETKTVEAQPIEKPAN